jgi:hypothetical protein
MAEASQGTQSSGTQSGSDAGTQTGSEPKGNGAATTTDVQAQIEQAISGLQKKNYELIDKLKRAQTELDRYTGIDPTHYKSMLSRAANEEEARLLAEGKLDEAFEIRTRRLSEAHKADLAAKDEEIEKRERKASRYVQQVFENGIRTAALDANVLPEAIKYGVIGAAAEAFYADDDGNIVARDGQFGKDGRPLTLKEWFAEMKSKASIWWPATQGGGATGGGESGPSTMKRAAFDSLSQRERDKFIEGGGRVVN